MAFAASVVPSADDKRATGIKVIDGIRIAKLPDAVVTNWHGKVCLKISASLSLPPAVGRSSSTDEWLG
jgi:hypothetical protein